MTRLARPGGSPPTPRSVDVARLAGVSQKTVSRVINDEQYVSADVRRRVLEAAEELGYRRNHAARALASGRTRSIGVVTLGTRPLRSRLAAHGRRAGRPGHGLHAPRGQHDRGRPGGIAGAVESLLDQGVDGIVISEPIDEGVGLSPRRRAGPGPRRAARLHRPAGGDRRARRRPAGAGRHRAPAGAGARDRPPPRRSAAVVRGPGPARGLARGAGRARRGASRRSSRATGRPPPDTRRAANWPTTRTSPRCSPRTTTWPSA